MKKAWINKNPFGLKCITACFPFDVDDVRKVKKLPGAVWIKKTGKWELPLTLSICFLLKKQGYVFRKDLTKWANSTYTKKNAKAEDLKILGLNGVLMPFQKEGVLGIEAFDGRALLADEMGLGKTIQTLAWLQLRYKLKPVLIICPASLKLNWQKEALKWMYNTSVEVLYGRSTNEPEQADIYVINYDIVHNWLDVLKAMEFQVIIMDEMHYIKEAGNKKKPIKRTRAVMNLCRGIPHIIGLTGTPIESKTLELYNPCKIINPSLFPNNWAFKHRYCGAKNNGFGWTFDGATNVEELHQILIDNIMIRRLKKDVLKDLPDKQYSFLSLAIDNPKEYQQAELDFIEYLMSDMDKQANDAIEKASKLLGGNLLKIDEESLELAKEEKAEKSSALTQIEVLKQLAVKGKMKACIEWIEDFLKSGEKLVVFGIHKFVIEELYEKFNKIAVKIDGSTSMKQRQKAVDSFQNSKKTKLFIGNIEAAGVGITLTASSNVAFVEYPWTPGKLNQAIDRCHRIGQENSVTAYFLIAHKTVEEKIIKLLHEKQNISDAVLDGKALKNTHLLKEIINQFKNR